MKPYPFHVASLLLSFAIAMPNAAHAGDKSEPAAHGASSESVPTDAEGRYRLAQACIRGAGVKKDPARAYELLKSAAEQGHAGAIGGIGYFYANGIVVKADLAEAASWFRRGAEKGGAKAQVNYGLALLHGRGVLANEAEGVMWIDKAAAQGLPEANFRKGEFLYNGTFGHKQNSDEALRYYLLAAEAGHAGAQKMAGWIYQLSYGGGIGDHKAEFWYRKAAEQGEPKAMFALARFLGTENPDEGHRIEAFKWLMVAGKAGEKLASILLNSAIENETERVISEARKQADAFRPRPVLEEAR